MRIVSLGQLLFAGSLAGLGVLSLFSGDFALNWQPVAAWVPWRQHLAQASGLVLCAGGLGMLLKRSATLSALVLAIYTLVWLLVLRAPRVVMEPTTAISWLGFSENLALLAGGWILLASLATPEESPRLTRVAGDGSVRLARFLYAVALPLIGLSHFVYAEGTTALVPAWLPDRLAFTYLTGAGQIAAGVGLLLTILPRAAAALEALLLSSFTLLVWVPRVLADPSNRFPWTALFVSSAVTGAAWAVVESLHGVGWGRASKDSSWTNR
jgi:uncharacterized membrane protein